MHENNVAYGAAPEVLTLASSRPRETERAPSATRACALGGVGETWRETATAGRACSKRAQHGCAMSQHLFGGVPATGRRSIPESVSWHGVTELLLRKQWSVLWHLHARPRARARAAPGPGRTAAAGSVAPLRLDLSLQAADPGVRRRRAGIRGGVGGGGSSGACRGGGTRGSARLGLVACQGRVVWGAGGEDTKGRKGAQDISQCRL